jgi:homopolymeric O-antigen transport system ATP-binding protein
MSPPIIRVENLSKHYVVGHWKERGRPYSYVALREVLAQELRNAARKAVDVLRGRQVVQGDTLEEFWALRDVSFDVQQGEVLGIVGRNGAGKTTLLKLLSRITEPTHGRITLCGRVASLLEVGTGFHPELTGRENIYLNGAILGMNRSEIRKKFDQIVAFAEVERFLDTPVKRYSSGMYVRLAFAVAAHLEPEILIVDEVLAVGDAEFQKKCLGKMDDVARREGRTVLFVSHNLAAVAQLTNRALLLKAGTIAFDGETPAAISAYLAGRPERSLYVSNADESQMEPFIARAEVVTSRPNGVQDFGEPLHIKVWVRHNSPMVQGCLGLHLVNQSQVSATAIYAYPPNHGFGQQPGLTLVQFSIPFPRTNVGKFHLKLYLTEPPVGKLYEIVDEICNFEIVRHDFFPWWGPAICTYHEDFSVRVSALDASTPIRGDGDVYAEEGVPTLIP